MSLQRVNGEYLGTCRCGCGTDLYERIWLYPSGGICTQAYWGMTDQEMAAVLGTTEAPWIGKATARRILLALTGPRRPCEFESAHTRRAKARADRAEYRAEAAERKAS